MKFFFTSADRHVKTAWNYKMAAIVSKHTGYGMWCATYMALALPVAYFLPDLGKFHVPTKIRGLQDG